jgi:hypothetical protein
MLEKRRLKKRTSHLKKETAEGKLPSFRKRTGINCNLK